MSDGFLDRAWQELRDRRLLGPQAPVKLAGGNTDRNASGDKLSYRIELPTGAAAKLTIGRNLNTGLAASAAWTTAYPSLGATALFQLSFEDHEFHAEPFFDGSSLHRAVVENCIPAAVIHGALVRITSAMDSPAVSSSEAARREELDTWCGQLARLPIWSADQRAFITETLLPPLFLRITDAPAAKKWIHGDLTDHNILITGTGDIRVIDAEFARETHFYAIEAAHFRALSTSWFEQPALYSSAWPHIRPEWMLLCWLNQIQREVQSNTTEYVARWLPDRLSRVATFIEQVFGSSLGSVPWERIPLNDALPGWTAQLFQSSGEPWSEEHSIDLGYRSDRVQSLFFRLEEQAEFLRFDPIASSEQVEIERIAFHAGGRTNVLEFVGPALHRLRLVPLADTSVAFVSTGLQVHAVGGDPQLAFCRSEFPDFVDATWVEVQIAPRALKPAPECWNHHLEEARWIGQPNAFGLRLSGWCIAPAGPRLTCIEAYHDQRLLASSLIGHRKDVALAFPLLPEAAESGFVLNIPAVPPEAEIRLIARTEGGDRHSFYSAQAGTFPHFGPVLGPYATWAQLYDATPAAPAQPPEQSVRFSVLLPVYNTPPRLLRECVESVRKQHYPHWELCVVDDASTAPWIRPLLEELSTGDSRIRLQRRTANGGIARATNDALASATGDYVVFLDHDDLLRPHALLAFADELRAQPDSDALYSDEDKITEAGERIVPFFKPDFSPEFLLHVMYVGHALCVRTRAARDCGGIDPRYDGVQDFEFFLRLTEHTSRIAHLPRILYHWRQSAGSSALHGNVKGDMDQKQQAAVAAHLQRRKSHREAIASGGHRVRIASREGVPAPRTALILAWPMHRTHPACAWAELGEQPVEFYAAEGTVLPANVTPVRRLSAGRPQHLLQQVAAVSNADVLVLLTVPPVELSAQWLQELAAVAMLPDTHCVAPLLLSVEGKILESGWTTSGLNPSPIMRGFDASGDGYNGSLVANREVSAVSATCVAMRHEIAAELGGLGNAAWLQACEARSPGRFNRVCAAARIRVLDSWRWEPAPLDGKHTGAIEKFYNPHFRQRPADYQLGFPPLHLAGMSNGFVGELETPPPERLDDGCLTLRGWCFRVDGKPVTLFVDVAGINWSSACTQPRPDVASIYQGLTNDDCGYLIRLRLPAGRHTLEFRASTPDSPPLHIRRQTLIVPRLAGLRRLRPEVRDRAAFQMLAGPSAKPAPIRPERFPKPSSAPAKWPRISVVTPSYQQVLFLDETMRSVLEQPHVALDYIVQDGGSTDGSLVLIKANAPRLHAWEHAPDAGQADAVVRGFAKSSGAPTDIMAWLNSDDFYLTGALAYVAEYFARHPDVDVVYGNRIVIDGDSREIGRWFLPAHDPEVLRLNDYIPQETLFWRRRIWDAVGGVNPSHQFALDWDLLLRFQAAGAKIVHVPYFLACFRVHPAQKTSASIHTVGQDEIDRLRLRSLGREMSATELEQHPSMLRYVRRSAEIELLWRHLHLRCH